MLFFTETKQKKEKRNEDDESMRRGMDHTFLLSCLQTMRVCMTLFHVFFEENLFLVFSQLLCWCRTEQDRRTKDTTSVVYRDELVGWDLGLGGREESMAWHLAWAKADMGCV